ncbi:MAG: hypothetical protein NXI22_17520 [bacterium]|nr:hypothetical protein [bacterium]
MIELFAVTLWGNHLWYLFPLVVTISLVYGATRHELMEPILYNALRAGVWIIGFMLVIFAIMFVLSWNL